MPPDLRRRFVSKIETIYLGGEKAGEKLETERKNNNFGGKWCCFGLLGLNIVVLIEKWRMSENYMA